MHTTSRLFLPTLVSVLALSACGGETTTVVETAPSSEEPTTLKFDRSPQDGGDESSSTEPETTETEDTATTESTASTPETISVDELDPRLREMYEAAVAYVPEAEKWAADKDGMAFATEAGPIEGVGVAKQAGPDGVTFELHDETHTLTYDGNGFLAHLPVDETALDSGLVAELVVLQDAIEAWNDEHDDLPSVRRDIFDEDDEITLSESTFSDVDLPNVVVPLDERWETVGFGASGDSYSFGLTIDTDAGQLGATISETGISYVRATRITD